MQLDESNRETIALELSVQGKSFLTTRGHEFITTQTGLFFSVSLSGIDSSRVIQAYSKIRKRHENSCSEVHESLIFFFFCAQLPKTWPSLLQQGRGGLDMAGPASSMCGYEHQTYVEKGESWVISSFSGGDTATLAAQHSHVTHTWKQHNH